MMSWISTYMTGMNSGYSYKDYIKDLQGNNIETVTIIQNEEAPTGKVHLTFKDGREKGFYVVNTDRHMGDYGNSAYSPGHIRPQTNPVSESLYNLPQYLASGAARHTG